MSWFNPDKPYTGTGQPKDSKTSLAAKVLIAWRDKDGKRIKKEKK
jgi:hypothetical protein